ncbi:TetR/AcrR family transcriptional regulator [soil metagenome]
MAAGRDILELAGPTGVTMNAVAQRVNVKAPSLYKRVRDRDALLGLIADSTIDDLGARTASIDTLTELARTFRSFAKERPEGFRLMFAGGASTDALSRSVEPVLRVSTALVGEQHALEAARLIVSWSTGFLSMELAGAFRMGGDVDEAFEFGLARIAAALQSH